MNRQFLQTWWVQHDLGKYVCGQEHDFVQSCLNVGQPERVLCVGMDLGVFRLPERCGWVRQDVALPADVVADALALPWQAQSFDWVVAVHELDCVGSDWQRWLAEMWRVLQPSGRLILTGFNPYSLWRLGWGQDSGLVVGDGVRLHDLKVWLLNNGWKIEQGQFLNYLPPVDSLKWIEKLRFLEYIGNRWLPHGAAVYALMLRKDVLGVRPCGQTRWTDFSVDDSVWALARDELK